MLILIVARRLSRVATAITITLDLLCIVTALAARAVREARDK
jgi:hypothetical protein